MAGRKPIPTEIQELKGAYKKDPQRRPKDAVSFVREDVTCPDHLGEIARGEWSRLYAPLSQIGLMSAPYRAAFAAYCQNYQRWVEAETQLREFGVVLEGPTGLPAPNPYLKIADTAMTQMRAFLVEFGMTPSSKTRTANNNGGRPITPSQVAQEEGETDELALLAAEGRPQEPSRLN